MAKPRGNPDKLVNFKKGEDERRNVTGANAGSQSLKSILERLLSKQIRVEQDGEILTVTRKEAIALNMIIDAHTEEDPNIRLKAAKMIFDNTDPITKDISVAATVEQIAPVLLNIHFRPPTDLPTATASPEQPKG